MSKRWIFAPMNGSRLLRNPWLVVLLACLSLVLASCSRPPENSASSEPKGHSHFELLGMLSEYGARRLDDPTSIEMFYPAEVAAADHFEVVLREFCADESLAPDWRRTKEESGHMTFTGNSIAASLNRSYVEDARYFFGMYRVGIIAPAVRKSASKEDILRYIVGAYIRYGDCDGRLRNPRSAHRAFFSAANNHSKFCVLREFLPRVGCTQLRYYDTEEAETVPTGCFMTFSPSAEVKAATGILREITLDEIKAWDHSLKEQKLPEF